MGRPELPGDAVVVAELGAATRYDVRRLRRAIDDYVAVPTRDLVTWRGPQGSGQPHYHRAVQRLEAALIGAHAMPVFDWVAWSETARLDEPASVLLAPLADVLRLVTRILRGERLAAGTVARSVESGVLLAAADRVLQALESR